MSKALEKLTDVVVAAANKLTKVVVSRGKTAWPKSPKEQERVGIRFDYDGKVTKDGEVFNKF